MHVALTQLNRKTTAVLAKTTIALTLAAAIPVLSAGAASAQLMPDNGSYLNAMIQQQVTLQRQGDMAARQIAWKCYYISLYLRQRGIDPGNCGATPQSASAAIQRMNSAQQQYIGHTQVDLDRNQWISGESFSKRVIQDCSLVYNQYDHQYYWACP